jgi:2-haloacid dehalogenase/putative hydrolase of the HAD superfamily
MKLVIFDLDDTLVDFAATRRIAHLRLSELLTVEGIEPLAYLKVCTEIDRALFTLFEQGTLTREQYRARRFADPFDRLGLSPRSGLVAQLNKLFMDCVNDSPLLHDDVWPTIKRLRSLGLQIAILTNGPSDGQRRKLKACGLGDAVDHIAIGEEIGASKPQAAAFRSVLDRFGLEAEHALMVGDSPELDYDAAVQAGLKALLLDRDGSRTVAHRRSIRSLHEVHPETG